jgi:hypothetical protein
MKAKLLVLVALVSIAASSPASASPITYTLIDVAANFYDPPNDTLTGTFTFNPSTDQLDSVDITLQGCCFNGVTWTTPVSATSSTISSYGGNVTLEIVFSADLADQPDPITGVIIPGFFGGPGDATGYADPSPVPIPSTLPLFGTVLAAGVLFAWRWKRKNAAARAVL